jgi:hypothetical protein
MGTDTPKEQNLPKTKVEDAASSTPTLVEAQALLAGERRQRASKCLQDIEEVLKKYNCKLISNVQILDGRITSGVTVISQ